MAYFPLFIKLNGKKVLLIGGGKVAYRKLRLLMQFEADIMIIAPEMIPEIEELGGDGLIKIRKREFKESDISGEDPYAMAIAATDDRDINKRIAEIFIL